MKNMMAGYLAFIIFGAIPCNGKLSSREIALTEKSRMASESSVNPEPVRSKITIKVNWNKVIRKSRTIATIQIVPNPSHERGSRLHDQLWNSLKNLNADFVRYSPWGEYPNLKIAELEPPANGKTSWDFSALDPMFSDFINAVGNHPFIMNYQAIPGWMLLDRKNRKPTKEIGSLFRDPTGMELAGYFRRIVEWYAKGGFTDELGQWHNSGHHYPIQNWEFLNEPDHESIGMTRELYTSLYDVVASQILKAAPGMKFMGMSMSNLRLAPDWTAYFLDKKNHKPGIPLDFVSYHLYSSLPANKNTVDQYPYTVFTQADRNLERIRIADSIRHVLSPSTRIDINESGILFSQVPRGWGRMNGDSIPDLFWNLSAAYYAYIYTELSKMGIEILGESTLWSDPNDWPEVSVIDWKTGKPNARYRVLKMIIDNFNPGDRLADTQVDSDPDVSSLSAQAFITTNGKKKILLVNKTRQTLSVRIPGINNGKQTCIDQANGPYTSEPENIKGSTVPLGGFNVMVITLP